MRDGLSCVVCDFCLWLWHAQWCRQTGFTRHIPCSLASALFSFFKTRQVLGEHPRNVERTLAEFGVRLRSGAYSQDVKPLLKEACSAVFGSAAGLVDMLVQHVPSSKKATAAKVKATFTGGCLLGILVPA